MCGITCIIYNTWACSVPPSSIEYLYHLITGAYLLKNDRQHQSIPQFSRLFEIIKTLRGTNGCPWDIEQTAESLRGDLLEESYECIDAINQADDGNLREELGDLFLVTTMISYIKEQDHSFTVDQVFDDICEKLIRRHPHVFSDSDVTGSEEVVEQWDNIKRDVEGKDGDGSILSTVPVTLPPLEKAFRLQKKAAKVGFDWQNLSDVMDKVKEEIKEREAVDSKLGKKAVEDELGDLLFAVVNLCRHYKVDPALALHGTNAKFINRFEYIEKAVSSMGKQISKEEFELMDRLWDEAKSREI